ncbi:hypothetical protein PKOR_10875 [Pontibacter korlensis]|uniref:Uncharacterized protein n=1 Tax=Pontibacter korlensis TaxID=400092 RepID=A0A0E3UWN6_9BACT|nr:T9SS C-terminal target domain-containing protein [Pontibacter korlensis]AKD03542.1 hypothetical protein PKOR_10875 [Pontibacter korlensis]
MLSSVSAQKNNTVPVFNVDLTGEPNGTWTSGSVTRNGQLCGADSNDNCVQFNITLDRNAAGLEFEIIDGPVPSGSMGYQIDCGPQVQVGDPICVDGTGPHVLTLCMPGNAKGEFVIKSIAAFEPQGDVSVTAGCSTTLFAPIAFEEESITWNDITGGGVYNKYLSFPNGNANPVVTPDENAPAYVDYEVCGRSVASPCSTLPYCDVVRVYFYPPPVINIGPEPAIICPGGSGVVLSGTVTGGDGNFSYIWTDAAGNQVGNQPDYVATTPGMYKLEARNVNYPNCREFSASVEVFSNLTVNAGVDQLVCAQNPVQLSGVVTAAIGGVWSGGAGTFSPSNTDLNATYTPTEEEIRAGSVKLRLTSTGNGSCDPVADEVVISFYEVNVELTGTPVICSGTLGTITANVTGANGAVSYLWSSGETTASITGKPAGTYTVTVNNGQNCSIQKEFTVTEVQGPTGFTTSVKSETCGASNGSITVSDITDGTAPYTYSKDGKTFQASATLSGLAAGSYTIVVKDDNGCTFSKSVSITNIPGPTAVAATTTTASCANNDGSITVGRVTGGTASYTYSINGKDFQEATLFSGLASGTYTVTAKDANGCTITTPVRVAQTMPTGFSATTKSSTCGNSNGEIIVTGVSGGTAPYSYSLGGSAFQTSATFTGLAAKDHIISVKDAKGCTFSKSVLVNNVAGPSDLTATVKASTCGDSNAEMVITVAGGTSPYAYSLTGDNFQSSNTFVALLAGDYTAYVMDAKGCVYTEAVNVPDIPGPDFILSAQASTCGGSNAEVAVTNVTGGKAPYIYSIDGETFQDAPSFTGLLAGTYDITVADANGCTAVKQVEVQDIAGPSELKLTANSSTCGSNNGSIVVGEVVGGSAPFAYSINDGGFQTSKTFGTLVAGKYKVTVKDANDCTFSKEVVVENIAGPTDFAVSATSSTCGNSNGELSVTGVTGGTAPYTYSRDGVNFQESGAFAGLAAGTHRLTVKDANGCVVTKDVTVTNIAGPSAVAATSAPASCQNNDGSITVGKVTGGAGSYTYSVNGRDFQEATLFSGLASGTYTVTAKDANNCTVTTSVRVGQNVPTALTASSVSATCGNSNGGLTVTGVAGGTAPYTYSVDGSAFQTSATFTGLAAGTHTVTVKDAKGCTYSKAVNVSNIAGPSDLEISATSSTCGNSNGELRITGVSGGTGSYEYSLDGKNFQTSATFTALAEGTYTVTVQDGNGCLYSEDVAVNNIAGPSFTLAAQASTCRDSNGSIAVTNAAGGKAPYSYSIDGDNFQSSASFTGLLAGTYTITVRDANECTLAKEVVVTDIPGPSDMALESTSSTCGNSNGVIRVAGVTGGTAPYVYSLNGGSFQSEQTFALVLAGDYTVTVKDANGCTFSKGITVNNIAGPSDLAATSTSSTCGNSNGQLVVSGVTGGTAPYTYSIDGGDFQSATTFAGLAAGSHAITVRDANKCVLTKSFTISNIAGPTVVTASAQPASCQNNDGSITVGTVTGGTASYTYSINGKDFQSTKAFSGLASGIYTVTAKDANGCEVTTTVRVNQNVPTNFASSTVSSTCGNNNGSITISGVTGGSAPYYYKNDGWEFQVSNTFQGLLAGAHTITVRDAKGCTFTKSVMVTNIAGPSDLTASVSASTCGGNNGSFTISNIEGGKAPYSYSIDGKTFQDDASFTAVIADTYTVHIRDANGCEYTEDVVVPDITGPAFTATAQNSTCGNSNGSITLSDVTGGVAPYTYSKDNVTFQSSATFTGLIAGTYDITVKDKNGCVFTKAIEVGDVAGPSDIRLTSTSSTCGGRNGSIKVESVTGGTSAYTYSIDGSTFQAGSTFRPVLAGEYTVTVQDANGCTFSKEVVVENIAGPTDFAVSATSSTCGNSNGELSVTGVTGGTAPYTYSRDGVNFQESGAFAGLAAGTHRLTVKDANGCVVTKDVTVTNIAGPSAVAATSAPASCQNNDGSITVGKVTGGAGSYTYSVNGRDFQEATLFSGLASGTYTVTAKDANNCTVTTSVRVGQNVPTALTASSVSATCGNSNGGLTVTGVAGGTAPYTYSVDGSAFQTSATFTGLAAGTHTVSVKDAKGCTYTGSVGVKNLEGPTFQIATTSTTCGASNGRVEASNVTGGVSPYTYSINGTDFQDSNVFSDLLAGSYTITVKDANGCLGTSTVEVEDIAGPSEFSFTAKASTCGNSNGSIVVSEVTGGTAPYTYSKNGESFQASATFENITAGDYTIIVKDANGCIVEKSIAVENIPGPSELSLVSVASTCGSANGSISVEGVTGGTAPYSFSIDGSTFQAEATFSSVTAGDYTVIVKDANGCTYAKEVTVENIAGPVNISVASKASTCGSNNGELSVTDASGGTAPYTYSIDGANFKESALFTGLLAGSYTVTVKDANGCTFAYAASVSDIAGPTAVAATAEAASCANNDGRIIIGAVNGGTAPYTYSIDGVNFQSSTSFASLATGDYTITAKDANGCMATGTVSVNQNVPTNFTASSKASTCGGNNGTVTVRDVSGGTAPYAYSKDGVNFQQEATLTGLVAGVYTIVVKDAKGCTFSKQVQVEDIAGPTEVAVSTEPSTCGDSNGTITISEVIGGVAPYTYSINGTDFQSSTGFSSLLAGEYELTVKDANGCTYTQAVILNNIPGPTAFSALANPSSCGRANGTVTVNDLIGGTAPYAYSANGTTFQEEATLTGLVAGEHIITVRDANGCIVTKSVVVDNIEGPTGMELVSASSTCGASNGSISVSNVTGGTAPYTYLVNGTDFQTSTRFEAILAGKYSITVRDANSCTFSAEVTVENIAGPTNLAAETKPSTCGASNGELSITSVDGGTAPYTYSIDGENYQASAAFRGLAAGTQTITVKDANGCTYATSLEVPDVSGPTAVAANSKAASCAGNDGSITVSGITGGTAPYTYSIDGVNFQASRTFEALVPGEYTITVKDTNGCNVSGEVEVGKEGPAGFTSSSNAASCGNENGSITISAVEGGKAPYTYSISGGAYQTASTFISLAAGVYTITVKDANGCAFTNEVEVHHVEGPSDLTASAQTASCGRSNGQITITAVAGGVAPYTFSINGKDFQASDAFTALVAGEYRVTVRDANGCLFAKPVAVTNANGPTGFQITTTAAACGSANGKATVGNTAGGTAPYTYSADGVNFQADATLTGLSAGVHTITVRDAKGCTFAKQAEVGHVAGPSGLELATVSATCGSANGEIRVSNVTGGTAPYVYALDEGGFQTSAVFSEVTAGNHTITVKDANGCVFLQEVKVTDIAGPSDIAATTTPASCTENNGTITVTGATGGSTPYTYSLDGISYQASAAFTALAAGRYEVYVKDANGCSTSVTAVVESKGLQEATVSTTGATCGKNNGAIVVTSVSGGTAPYTYSLDGTSFQTSASFNNLAAGKYTVVVKDAEGCTLTKKQLIENSGSATFNVTATNASCGADNGAFRIEEVSGGTAPYTYSIDGAAYQSAPEFKGLAAATYQVTLKDATGCISTETITIGNTPAITDLGVTVTPAGCNHSMGQVAIGEVTGGTAPYTYSLDGVNYTSSTTLSDVAPGNYTLTVKDAKDCTFSIPVKMEEGVSSSLDYVQHLNCYGDATGVIAFTATGADAQTVYSIDNGKTFQKEAVFKNLAAGTYQLITKFSETCAVTVGTVEVKAAEPILLEVTPLTKAIGLEKSGSAAVTTISGGVGPYTYQVNGGSFSSDSVFSNLGAGTYTLMVKDSRGCIAEISFEIEGLDDLDIPNGFTPNGDGVNDTWVLKNLPRLYPQCRVSVYNRWGSPVYTSRGYAKPWDGTYNGKRLPDGTYYCIIELGDGTAPLKTSVTIMR